MNSQDCMIYKFSIFEKSNKEFTVSVKVENFGNNFKNTKHSIEFGVIDQLNHLKMGKSAYCHKNQSDFQSVSFVYSDLNNYKRSDSTIAYYLKL